MNKARLKKRSKLLEVAKLNDPALNEINTEEKPVDRGRQIKIISGYTPPSASADTNANPFKSNTETEITYSSDKKTISLSDSRTERVANLFKHFKELRSEGRLTNMTLIVEGRPIEVHRTLLAASSKYFKKILTRVSNRKDYDSQANVVHVLKDADFDSVNLCLDFIYSCELHLEVETLEGMLRASRAMQIKELVSSCYSFIEIHVRDPRYSVVMAKISARYLNGSTEKLVKNFIQKNFEYLLSTEGFLKQSEAELYEYIVEYSPNEDQALQAILGWINHNGEERKESILNLVKVFTFDNFPTDNFIQKILSESVIVNSPSCQDIFAGCIFSNVKKLEEGLSVSNCFNLREMAKKSENIFDDCVKAIVVFMIDHFDQISVKDEFLSMTKEEVMMLFENSDDECFSSEKFKWFAALRWLKHDQDREIVLTSIFKTIRFYKFPKEFMEEVVMNEPLVKASRKCKKIIKESLLIPPQAQDEYISVLTLYGEISAMNLASKTWSPLSDIGELEKSEIFSLNKKLCLLTPKMIFFLGRDDKWFSRTEVDDIWLMTYYQVATTDDRMYFIGRRQLSFYDVMKDLWTCDLTGCGIDRRFCVIALGEFVYAFGAKEAKKYHTVKGIWIKISHPGKDISRSTTVGFNHRIILVSSVDGKCHHYDPVLDKWSASKSAYVVNASEICAFVSSDKLLMVCKVFDTVTMYMFDERCDKWNKMQDIIAENIPQRSSEKVSKFILSPSTVIPPSSTHMNGSDTNNNNSSSFKALVKNPQRLANDLFVSLPNTINEFIPPTNKNGRQKTVMSACVFEKVSFKSLTSVIH